MDEAEKLSEDFLRIVGFKKIIYEPDGNIPPDFLCDDRVAIEVRRLNRHFLSNGGHVEPLEKKEYDIWNTVKATLERLGPPTMGKSWYVSYSFSRPIPDYKKLPKLLIKILQEFRKSPTECEIEVTEGFTLRLTPAKTSYDLEFFHAGAMDEDGSGFLLDMMEKNIQLCIDEKSGKVKRVREKYSEWWLVLVDRIGLGLNDFEQELFKDSVRIDKRDWDQIVLIDPRDSNRYFYI